MDELPSLRLWDLAGSGVDGALAVGIQSKDALSHAQHVFRGYAGERLGYYNNDRVRTELQDSPMGRPTEHRSSSDAQVVG
jgi:hypothetical protein